MTRGLIVPDGFEPFAWFGRVAGSMKDVDGKPTVMHLHDPDEPLYERKHAGEIVSREPWKGLCGATAPHKRRALIFDRDARQYASKHCDRCLRLAAERIHVARFTSHRTGVSNRYGRGASGSGGRNTHVRCSCGWENTSNVRQRESETYYREHLHAVVEHGLWRIERERYPSLVTAAPFAYLDAGAHDQVRELAPGETIECEVAGFASRRPSATVHRLALPMRRRAPAPDQPSSDRPLPVGE
jgi:hypothetical protein